MPHQFLHHLQFRTSCTEKCRVGSAECVATNPLCDAQPLRRGADVVTKKLLSPILGFSPFLGTGEHPTLRRSKCCSAMPAPQGADQIIVERYGDSLGCAIAAFTGPPVSSSTRTVRRIPISRPLHTDRRRQ